MEDISNMAGGTKRSMAKDTRGAALPKGNITQKQQG